jgi:hypothetical protein
VSSLIIAGRQISQSVFSNQAISKENLTRIFSERKAWMEVMTKNPMKPSTEEQN